LRLLAVYEFHASGFAAQGCDVGSTVRFAIASMRCRAAPLVGTVSIGDPKRRLQPAGMRKHRPFADGLGLPQKRLAMRSPERRI
jgi:hypothetical protein